MYIFACESSSGTASVALLRDRSPLGEFSVNAGNTHTETLLPMTDALLRACGITPADVGLFVLSAGPGSFTGVRIAAAHIKGLAFGRAVPAVAVSTLESLAFNLSGLCDIAAPCLDARRNQIYTSLFDCSGDYPVRMTPDEALPAADAADRIASFAAEGRRIAVPGDGSRVLTGVLKQRGIDAVTPHGTSRFQSAVSAALAGLLKYEKGEFTDAQSLRPVYLRVPQAERDRLERLNHNNNS
ncbi:MAG: tRNA (adenosine(37)-N6)-threonylcarbamoyltransferase complex dimerization subunit type 1 TsaB [Clostridia bacterium]|nr:tRNA (adenosine(37)-N6)-threonylcarbamoyltransferase complex dimerization subunit type 1 TsaB [Clostridia bacterium]